MELIEQDVLVNGLRLHVYRSGTGRPPLVFAHGITDNGLCFLPIAEQLADDFEIILYDARGHGKSGASDAKSSLKDLAQDLAGLIAALDLHKPGLIGHSMGAATVAVCAGSHPQVPGFVILEDPPAFEMLTPGKPGLREWREGAALNKKKSIDELVQLSRVQDPAWPEAERIPWAQAKQQLSLKIFDDDLIGIDAAQEIISRITCPALLLTADQKKGSLFPAEVADALAVSLPLGKHVNIPGAGHSIRREQPGLYLSAVRDFLRECL